jgi:redox-sensitive bicupin YhaK (pirin superfamily)
MITLRLANDRGHAMHGWLESHHTFSFADYHDPAHMGFGNLRVINDDRIAPGTGFGTHGHRDMEIVSYVLEGALAHKDSMGTQSAILPGEVQRMTAGTGVMHSEFNHASDRRTHFLQIWILPQRRGLPPSYEQKAFPEADKRGRLRRVAGPDPQDGAVHLNADAQIYVGLFDGQEAATLPLPAGRSTWVHLVRGRLRVNGHEMAAGDGMGLVDESRLALDQGRGAEVLVFDLAR